MNFNNKLQHSALPIANKKKKRVIDSPNKNINLLDERRGSRTPILIRETNLKDSDKILWNFNKAKKAAFHASVVEPSSDNNRLSDNFTNPQLSSKVGKSRNRPLKYSTYSKNANLVKHSKNMTTLKNYDNQNLKSNSNLLISGSSIFTWKADWRGSNQSSVDNRSKLAQTSQISYQTKANNNSNQALNFNSNHAKTMRKSNSNLSLNNAQKRKSENFDKISIPLKEKHKIMNR